MTSRVVRSLRVHAPLEAHLKHTTSGEGVLSRGLLFHLPRRTFGMTRQGLDNDLFVLYELILVCVYCIALK